MADLIARTKGFPSSINFTQLIVSSKSGSFASRWVSAKDVKRNTIIILDHVTTHRVKYNKEVPVTDKVTSFRLTSTSASDGPDTYPITIQMEKLSFDAGIKVRCGALYKYRHGDTREDMNRKGICPDFYFVFMHTLYRYGALYQRNTTNRMLPNIRNPQNEIGVCKHIAKTLMDIVKTGYFGRVDDPGSVAGKELRIKKGLVF
jgi:hypothetical protein